ncbi:MAG: hypothetical protein ACOCXJ_04850, partial [Planctomycetota bacterium]
MQHASSATHSQHQDASSLNPCQYIGPASVIEARADGSCLCLVGEHVRPVRMAMPMQYRPAAGDLL